MVSESVLTLTFHDSLAGLLNKDIRHGRIQYALNRRASIKDIIESLGIPHTEIGKIIVHGAETGFDYLPSLDVAIHIHPMTRAVVASLPNTLWQERWSFDAFMVDVNVMKLARNLRIAGFDTTIVPELDLVDIGAVASEQERVILTRNRQLLKCSTVMFGQLLRSEEHRIQLREVASRFGLASRMQPFSRCLTCNGSLEPVKKKSIEHLLKPLTRKYYTQFKRCTLCQAIYWHGSHTPHIQAILAEVELAE